MIGSPARKLTPTGYFADVERTALYVVPLESEPPPVNNPPTDILLSNNVVPTNAGTNAIVGTFSSVDADIGDTFTYSLVAGTGSTDNASFNISGANLRCNDPNALGAGTYSIRAQTSDGTDTFAKPFTILVVAPSTGSGTGQGKLKLAIRIGIP
jgi:hypothetical protein